MIAKEEILACVDEQALVQWIQRQRWYGSKSRTLSAVEIVEAIPLREHPALWLALVQTWFATGTHDIYQLPLAFHPADEARDHAPIARHDGWAMYDALEDPRQVLDLVERIDSSVEIDTADGRLSFYLTGLAASLGGDASARAMGVEQSNSSLVFDGRYVLKVFRKLEPGINPELELLRFLTRRGFPNIAPLQGWYEYEGQVLASTLGVLQEFLPDAHGGWEMALNQIETETDELLARIAELGRVTAELHTVLASDSSDPAFSPEEPSQEALSLLTATIDEDIERIFLRLPDDERVAPIAGRGEEVRDRLAARTHIGAGGRQIRTHGDYHLGQTLWAPRGWVIIDFEGEPARPLPERRHKRSPLRDVASMLRSFAYLTSAALILRGAPAPADFEERARDAFLNEYLATVEPTILPAGVTAVENLLAIFELEKAIYELQYELDNRPDWVSIPVAGIRRLLEESA